MESAPRVYAARLSDTVSAGLTHARKHQVHSSYYDYEQEDGKHPALKCCNGDVIKPTEWSQMKQRDVRPVVLGVFETEVIAKRSERIVPVNTV